ncbi:MAG TPA: type VI secretion system tube protein Hcp [Solirubrobacteraceae bacterium]|jgi:type VI protein secretion system component Hcp|nr:type VI secretion system tube protein Hcp [Solirubrobacteraceae bacterium]
MGHHALRKRLSYANVMSTACLFVVLGGSAYAAVSVTGKDVRNGSLTGADIRDHSLGAREFKRGARRAGPAGAPGPQGDPGRDGAPGAGVPAPPAVVQEPAGRLTLAGLAGTGPDGSIEVRSLAWSNVVSGYDVAGGGKVPAPVWGDITIAKAPDRASTELWKRTATGEHIASAELELLAPGATVPYATYVLSDVTVEGFSTQGSGDERQDTVQLGFNTAIAANPAFTLDPSAPLPAPAEPRVGRMTVDGIPGATAIVLDAWNVTGAGGPAQFGPFLVSIPVGPASPELLERFAAGAHIKSVTIELLQPGSADVSSTYVLTDVVITALAVAGDARPLERIGFDAARIESTTPVPGGQAIRSCFDRKLLASC